jgi:uncharacterized membrane protein
MTKAGRSTLSKRLAMTNWLGFIKTTLVGGFVFLIPAVIVVVALGKLLGALKALTKTLSPLFGVESLAGGLVLDLLAITVTVLLCFVAGLLAKRATARRLREKLDATLLNCFPGYAVVKGFAENLRHTEELSPSFLPVLVQFGDYARIAFETQREPSGRVAVCMPGAPNPWSGTVVYISKERVRPWQMTLTEALRNIRGLGKGSIEVAQEQNARTAHGT